MWNQPLTLEEIDRSITKYDEFHELMDIVTAYLLKQNRYGVIFDLHSYNYQREEKVPWQMNEKPVINIGTGSVNRNLFGDVIDDLLFSLNGLPIAGHPISVGENVVFKGGGLSRRLSPIYYDQLLFLAVEFKKIFMDEWSGRLYEDILGQLMDAFSLGVKQVVTHPFLYKGISDKIVYNGKPIPIILEPGFISSDQLQSNTAMLGEIQNALEHVIDIAVEKYFQKMKSGNSVKILNGCST